MESWLTLLQVHCMDDPPLSLKRCQHRADAIQNIAMPAGLELLKGAF